MFDINWLQHSLALGPELLLVIGGMLVLSLDMYLNDDRNPLLPGATFAILLGAFLWSLFLTPADVFPGQESGVVFGMYTLDNLTYFFRVFAIGATMLVLALTVDYINERSRQTGEFYVFLLFVTVAVIFVAASNNLVLLFLSFETLSITSYTMVGWLRDDARSNEAAMKYLLYGSISSAIMLYGMSLLYGATGSIEIREIAAAFADPAMQISGLFNVGVTAAVLMMVGFGFKAGLVPFHQWSPDAYEGAPTPVATFLSVGSKAAGFAIMIRLLTIALEGQAPAWQTMISSVAIVTMVVGNLVALAQRDMKRLLAYSSVAHAGYILMGLAAYDSDGLRAMMVYLMAYLFTNVGIFVAVVAVEHSTGSTTIDDYRGMVRRSPFIAVSMVVFFLSLLGIPPTAGFLGKFMVFSAAIHAELYVLAIVGVLTSVISAYYYLNVVREMFFRGEEEEVALTFPRPLTVTVGIALAGTLLMNLFPWPFMQLIQEPLFAQAVALLPF